MKVIARSICGGSLVEWTVRSAEGKGLHTADARERGRDSRLPRLPGQLWQ